MNFSSDQRLFSGKKIKLTISFFFFSHDKAYPLFRSEVVKRLWAYLKVRVFDTVFPTSNFYCYYCHLINLFLPFAINFVVAMKCYVISLINDHVPSSNLNLALSPYLLTSLNIVLAKILSFF